MKPGMSPRFQASTWVFSTARTSAAILFEFVFLFCAAAGMKTATIVRNTNSIILFIDRWPLVRESGCGAQDYKCTRPQRTSFSAKAPRGKDAKEDQLCLLSQERTSSRIDCTNS